MLLAKFLKPEKYTLLGLSLVFFRLHSHHVSCLHCKKISPCIPQWSHRNLLWTTFSLFPNSIRFMCKTWSTTFLCLAHIMCTNSKQSKRSPKEPIFTPIVSYGSAAADEGRKCYVNEVLILIIAKLTRHKTKSFHLE